MPDKFVLPTEEAWGTVARIVSRSDRTLRPQPPRKRRIYQVDTLPGSNTTTAGCGCCNTYDCINNSQAVIGACSGCPNGASLQYNLALGNWQAQPTATDSFGNVLFTNQVAVCSGLGTSSSSSSSLGDPCTWYSCPFFFASTSSSSSGASIGTYRFQMNFGLDGLGKSTCSIYLVFLSGTDWYGAGSGVKWFESHQGFNCKCDSPMYPVDATLIPYPTGINYAPCLIPVRNYRCCCNCFQIAFPGVTVNVPSSSSSSSSSTNTNVALLTAVCGAQTIQLNYTQFNSGAIGVYPDDIACTQYWAAGPPPNPHVCAWASWRAPDGTYPLGPFVGSPPAQAPYSFLKVSSLWPISPSTPDVISLLISFNDVGLGGNHYATAALYHCGNWSCDGGNFSFFSQSALTVDSNLCVNANNSGTGFTDDPGITASWPLSLTATAIACPTTSSSSSSS